MKIVRKNLKKGEIELVVENKEDLWYLNYLIEPDDEIKGKTVRKIKLGEETKKQEIVKKVVFIRLKAEKIDYEADILRIRGTILEGPEDVVRGSHHSFNVEMGTKFTIIKKQWLGYQLEKLEDAAERAVQKILLVVHDREEAYFALIQRYGYKLLTNIKGQVEKKVEGQAIKNFYKEIEKQILEYDKRYELKAIIVASPAFFKEDLVKVLGKGLHEKIVLATCSSVGENGIREVLKRDEAQSALKQERITEEMNLVEGLLVEIGRQGKAVYGIEETRKAVEIGAVEVLLISDKFILRQREKERFREIELLMKKTEQMKGRVCIISSEHEGGEKLDGLGGIGAITRWRTC